MLENDIRGSIRTIKCCGGGEALLAGYIAQGPVEFTAPKVCRFDSDLPSRVEPQFARVSERAVAEERRRDKQ